MPTSTVVIHADGITSSFTWSLNGTARPLVLVGGRVLLPGITAEQTISLNDFEWLARDILYWIELAAPLLPPLLAAHRTIEFGGDQNSAVYRTSIPQFVGEPVQFGFRYSANSITFEVRPAATISWADLVLLNNLSLQLITLARTGKRWP